MILKFWLFFTMVSQYDIQDYASEASKKILQILLSFFVF